MDFDFKKACDDMADVVKQHLAPVKGSTFHPVYITPSAYEPMTEIFKRAYNAGAQATIVAALQAKKP